MQKDSETSSRKKDRPDMRVLPPVPLFAFLIAGFALQTAVPLAFLPTSFAHAIALLFGIASASLAFWSLRTMKQASESPNIYKPTKTLITSGPFHLSRNPIYLSFLLLYLCMTALANSLWLALLSVPYILVETYIVIVPEERYLEQKFGNEYLKYKSEVRRWI